MFIVTDLVSLSDQFKKIIKRYKRMGYNMDVIQQSACMVVNSSLKTLSMIFHILIAPNTTKVSINMNVNTD